MAKLETQARLVNALRVFTGAMPPFYANEKEFFLVCLQDMTEYLGDLQREMLDEARVSFIQKLEAGKVTLPVIDEFKAVLDRLISGVDFRAVCASMAGSRDFTKQRLLALKPLSLLAEAKKSSGARDADAERRVNGAYNRMNFPRLAKEVEASPNDFAVNAALAKARAEAAEYCSVYRVRLREADTLTPFSVSYVDAAMAAVYRLFKNTSSTSGRAM